MINRINFLPCALAAALLFSAIPPPTAAAGTRNIDCNCEPVDEDCYCKKKYTLTPQESKEFRVRCVGKDAELDEFRVANRDTTQCTDASERRDYETITCTNNSSTEEDTVTLKVNCESDD